MARFQSTPRFKRLFLNNQLLNMGEPMDIEDQVAEFSTEPFSKKPKVEPIPKKLPDHVDPEFDIKLKQYYGNLFPYDSFYTWLSYNDINKFRNREFSFTLQSNIYIRFNSFKDIRTLQKRLVEARPAKMDIGAIYNYPPADKDQVIDKSSFIPIERELVFDIDITDYKEIREYICNCEGATTFKCCETCWKLMTAAIKVLEYILKEVFGFERILFVFSGRRGIHCWVSDERARKLSNEAREAILKYISFFTKAEQSKENCIDLTSYTGFVEKIYDLIGPYFVETCVTNSNPDKGLFNDKNCHKLLEIIPNTLPELKNLLSREWKNNPINILDITPATRWIQFDESINNGIKTMKVGAERENLKLVRPIVIFNFMYPRLDVAVSINMNHLLKTPFAVHPDTGKVCVPIFHDPKLLDTFNPNEVPTLSKILDEVKNSNLTDGKAWLNTSLQPYLDYFYRFVHPNE